MNRSMALYTEATAIRADALAEQKFISEKVLELCTIMDILITNEQLRCHSPLRDRILRRPYYKTWRNEDMEMAIQELRRFHKEIESRYFRERTQDEATRMNETIEITEEELARRLRSQAEHLKSGGFWKTCDECGIGCADDKEDRAMEEHDGD